MYLSETKIEEYQDGIDKKVIYSFDVMASISNTAIDTYIVTIDVYEGDKEAVLNWTSDIGAVSDDENFPNETQARERAVKLIQELREQV